jgi:tetratricopeptide (TPR) repeat protein
MKRNLIRTLILATLIIFAVSIPTTAQDNLKAKVLEIETAYAEGYLDKVIDEYKDKINDNPSDAVLRYLLGVAYLYSEFDVINATFDDAFRELSMAKELDPKMKYVNYSLGYIHWARKEYDKAIVSYKAEIGLDPDYAWNYFNLGQAYESLKEWDKAMSQYIMAIDKDPSIPDAHNNLGAIAMEWKGDYFRALDEFKIAINLDPEKKLYKENYNKCVRKLIKLRESLGSGELELPTDQVDKLKNMELKEIDVE